jgi:hypothetical protein
MVSPRAASVNLPLRRLRYASVSGFVANRQDDFAFIPVNTNDLRGTTWMPQSAMGFRRCVAQPRRRRRLAGAWSWRPRRPMMPLALAYRGWVMMDLTHAIILGCQVTIPSIISPKRTQLLPFQRASCSARMVW